MTEIHIAGRELGIPGSAHHAQSCTVDGKTLMVTVADMDKFRQPEVTKALDTSFESHSAGLRRVILDALRAALQPQGSSEVH
ncbi:MAG: hypothetical protein PHX87_06460 [Candidatus Peribacteraceae bacterium]|nr:hypothetical protein [Candidatus Peribacteraceae bacterium]MDD5743031.1 hypothetical protein [Candidatus Peribacteraceae bacterium]